MTARRHASPDLVEHIAHAHRRNIERQGDRMYVTWRGITYVANLPAVRDVLAAEGVR